MSRSKPTKYRFLAPLESVLLDLDLTYILDYIKFFESHLETEARSIEERLAALQKKMDQMSDQEQYESGIMSHEAALIDEFQTHERNYIQYFRQSQIIQIFSFLENALRRMCDSHAHQNGSTIKVKDLNGKDLEKVKTYLRKIAGVDINKLAPEWAFISNLNNLRNQLAHHHATISVDHPRLSSLKTFAKGRFSLKKRDYTDDLEIVLDDPSFFTECVKEVRSLFQKIDNYAD